ncbi:lipid A deacylase LpxR family protein [Alkalimarinus coralli]|uniref:lipid A deacylase LpxR family protein n=1 Tax=Alkalimarinus coralli TaxID=2935863 RepID=UPI00202B0B61|nr:lipid A deacylase LpxR family protein [Alkalimarinus coralli]
MRSLSVTLCSLLVVALVSRVASTHAKDSEIHWSAAWDNDAIANDDGGYTHGFFLNWGYLLDSDNSWETTVLNALPLPEFSQYQNAISYQLAQTIYTPSNIDTSDLILDDRPYAGLLFGAVNLYRFDAKKSSRYELLLGIAGPGSGAEYVQRYIHDIIGTVDPSGWHHQIGNEVVIRAGYEQLWRLYQYSFTNGIEYDLLSAADIRAGNLSSDIGGGMTIRVGEGLSNSFPMTWLTSGRTLPALAGSHPGEWSLFGTLYANYVFNDITIEGNTFKDSHGVHLVNQQWLYLVGGSYQFSNWSFSGSIQESSHTFVESDESTMFSTFTISLTW